MSNGNFWIPFTLGIVAGFFMFTAFGRDLVLSASERAVLEARKRVLPKIRGE